MKLTLRLRPEGKGRVPVHYNEYLQGVIYTHLNTQLAQELHNEGIPDGKRRLKLFTFSRLLGQCHVQDSWLEPQGTIQLVVASPMVSFLESLAQHIMRRGSLFIGRARFVVEAVEVAHPTPYQNPAILKALSPIVVYSTLLTAKFRAYL